MICKKEKLFNWTNRILKCFGTRLKAGLYWIEEGMAPMRKYGVREKSGTQSLRVQIPELTKPSLFTRGFLEVAGGRSDWSSPESLSGAPLFQEAGVVLAVNLMGLKSHLGNKPLCILMRSFLD